MLVKRNCSEIGSGLKGEARQYLQERKTENHYNIHKKCLSQGLQCHVMGRW